MNRPTATLQLRTNRDESVRRGHPWVFSGSVHAIQGEPAEGDLVRVTSREGETVGLGHYADGSIRARLVHFGPEEGLADDFWERRLAAAATLRRRAGLLEDPTTTACRLVNAEGDGLPGLIVDLYAGTAVIQTHSIGMHRSREAIARALRAALPERVHAVYLRCRATLPSRYGAEQADAFLAGGPGTGPVEILENGHRFAVDIEEGQKTGFFLDQRDNRALLGRYSREARVLNAFAYTGGFSVTAASGGARAVDTMDVSAGAVETARRNLALNGFDGSTGPALGFHAGDAFRYLEGEGETWDIVVIDPPAFAKSPAKRHKAVLGYRALNRLAAGRVAPGGLLFTFSCSQVVDTGLFENTVLAGVLEAGCRASILHRLGAPPDHPVSLHHPEGHYLKGLVLLVA